MHYLEIARIWAPRLIRLRASIENNLFMRTHELFGT